MLLGNVDGLLVTSDIFVSEIFKGAQKNTEKLNLAIKI